jgi:hypothetical protein
MGSATTASERLEARIDEAEEEGTDVTLAREHKEEFDERIERAREHYAQAREAYADGATPEAHESARASIAQAREELREAYVLIRLILAELRVEVVA